MLRSHFNDSPTFRPLTPTMIAALADAAGRFDSCVVANRRTWGSLYARGLVYYNTGLGTNRYGGTAYDVIVGVYLTDAGRACVASTTVNA